MGTEVGMLDRVKQFRQNIFYGFQDVDKSFLSAYLNERELRLFNQLKKSEKNHSIAVAKGVRSDLAPEEDESLVKAALFHDIGKIEKPLNLVEKSLAVIMSKVMGSAISRLDRMAFIGSYLYHGQRGERILRNEKIFEEKPLLYTLVGTHHFRAEELKVHEKEELLAYHTLLKKHDDRN